MRRQLKIIVSAFLLGVVRALLEDLATVDHDVVRWAATIAGWFIIGALIQAWWDLRDTRRAVDRFLEQSEPLLARHRPAPPSWTTPPPAGDPGWHPRRTR